MNDDFLLAPGALRQLIRVMEEHPEIGAIQGKILLMTGSMDNCGHKINEALVFTAITEPMHEVAFTSGCFSVYRMEAVKKINRHGGLLFEPDFFSYGDDNVLGLELWEAGYKCVCIDTFAGYHVGRASSKSKFQTYLSNRAWVALIVASDSRFRSLALHVVQRRDHRFDKAHCREGPHRIALCDKSLVGRAASWKEADHERRTYLSVLCSD